MTRFPHLRAFRGCLAAGLVLGAALCVSPAQAQPDGHGPPGGGWGGDRGGARERGGDRGPERDVQRGRDRRPDPGGPFRSRTDSGGEQGEVRRERQAGNVRPLREIEREVLPRMGGMQYLGPEYDPAGMSYRLKFIRGGKVHFIDIDARTGRIIGESR